MGFEPTAVSGERPQTYVLDCAATGTGILFNTGVLVSPWPDLIPNVFCFMVRIFLLILVLLYIQIILIFLQLRLQIGYMKLKIFCRCSLFRS